MFGKKSVVWLFVCVLSLGSSVSFAQPVGYIGGSWGSSSVDVSGYDSSGSYKIYFGTYFSRNVALELAYTHLGEFTYDEANGGRIDTNGYEMTLVGVYPVSDNWSLLARAGAYAWNADDRWQGSSRATDDGTSLTYGVGLSTVLSDTTNFQLEYQKYDDISGGNFDSIFGSLTYKF
ncbi:porin family protein [Sedimenticola sp.]|uniref:porin family protein n=1 Tax=Sedimenticola sp. TaxID=1940285 RepID=UPI003D09D458